MQWLAPLTLTQIVFVRIEDGLLINMNIKDFTEKDIARFWSKVNIKSENECWEWQKFTTPLGYGMFGLNKKDWQPRYFSHRVSYLLKDSSFDQSLFVCHKCDNPKCVNPNHLFLGTAKDNNLDKVSKNRQAKGRSSDNELIKINQEIADEIRKLQKQGLTYKELCDKFNLAKSTISYIVNNKIWIVSPRRQCGVRFEPG